MTRNKTGNFSTARRQRQGGAVLLFSLIILLILTVLGVTAMQTTGMQERMAGGLRDQHLSLQAAEAALRDGERFVDENVTFFYEADYFYRLGQEEDWDINDLASVNTRPYGGTANFGDDLAEAPVFFIQEMDPTVVTTGGAPRDTREPSELDGAYRIIARSTGATGNSETIIESLFITRE